MTCSYPRCGLFANILLQRLPDLRAVTSEYTTTLSIPNTAARLTDLVLPLNRALPRSRLRGLMLQRGKYRQDLEDWLVHFLLHCEDFPTSLRTRVNRGAIGLVLREPMPPDTGTRHSADLIPTGELISAIVLPEPGTYRLSDLAYRLAQSASPTLKPTHDGATTGALWTAYRALLTRAAQDPTAPRPQRIHFTPAARRGFRCEVS